MESDTQDCTYSAVSLCSQAIYPGDDQLLNLEKEILTIKYKILDDEFYNRASQAKVCNEIISLKTIKHFF